METAAAEPAPKERYVGALRDREQEVTSLRAAAEHIGVAGLRDGSWFRRVVASHVKKHAAERTKAGKLISVAGGGDTVAALNQAGVAGDFTYVSTAGGAFLEWMEGKPLPGVEVLRTK